MLILTLAAGASVTSARPPVEATLQLEALEQVSSAEASVEPQAEAPFVVRADVPVRRDLMASGLGAVVIGLLVLVGAGAGAQPGRVFARPDIGAEAVGRGDPHRRRGPPQALQPL